MNTSSNIRLLCIFALFGVVMMAMACEEYEAPAEAELVRSGTGAYTLGEPLMVDFSQAVLPETFEITLWPATRGTRRAPSEEVEAIAGPCRGMGNSCENIDVELSEDGMQAELTLDPELASPGATFVLEVHPGLTDERGNITGASYLYTVRYRATEGDPNANIQFDTGYYILGGSVSQPVPAVLTLVAHLDVLPDGRFVLAAAKGNVDEEVEKTSRDPKYIEVDTSEGGWTIFATGLVVENDEGERFLETDVFDVEIPVLGTLILEMYDVRLFAQLVKDEDGNDFFDGTLTYERLVLNDSEFDGDSTALLGNYVMPEDLPEGAPHLCESICGGVTGICDPPADLPHPDFCSDGESEEG